MTALPLWLVVSVLVMALAWLVPNHYLPWVAFHAEVTAAAGFTVLVTFTLAGAPKSVSWPRLALLAFGLAAVPLLQAAGGVIFFWGDAWMASLYMLGFALAIVVGHRLAERHDPGVVLPTLWLAVLAAAILSACIALCQWLGVPLGLLGADMPFGGRPYANLAQPNQLATLLALGIVASFALVQQRKIGMAGLGVVLSLLTFAIAMTGSRSGWLQVGFLAIWFLTMRRKAQLRVPAAAALGALLLLVVAVQAWPRASQSLLIAGGRSVAERASAGTRPTHWASVLDAISREPLLGYGWNQVSVAQSRVAAAYPATHEMIDHSHSMLLDLLAWNGIPLGLAVIVALGWWLFSRVRACRDGQVATLLAGIGAVAIHAMLEFPLDYAYFLLPVGLMIGMVDALLPARTSAMPRWATAMPAVVALALLIWTTLEYVGVEEDNRARRFEAARIGEPGSRPPTVPPLLLSQQRAFLQFSDMAVGRDMPSSQLEAMRHVAQRFGYASVLFRFAFAAGLNGHPQEAAEALSRLCKTQPIDRCAEAKEAWAEAGRQRYPELRTIPFPPVPERVPRSGGAEASMTMGTLLSRTPP